MALLGLIAATIVFFISPPIFESQAKVLVRYVVERNAIDGVESKVTTISGPKVMDAEIQILTSWDLCKIVANEVGIEKLAPEAEEDEAASLAARRVFEGLSVESNRGTQVIFVSYKDKNADVPLEVMELLLQKYKIKHLEVHRSGNALSAITKESLEAKAELATIEEDLKGLKEAEGIFSPENAEMELMDRLARREDELMIAESDLAQQQALVKALTKQSGAEKSSPAQSVGKPSQAQIEEFRALGVTINNLRQRKSDLTVSSSSRNPLVRKFRDQIEEAEVKRKKLIENYPSLALSDIGANGGGLSVGAASANLAAISAKVETLKRQRDDIKAEIKRFSTVGPNITALEQRRNATVKKVETLEANLSKAKIDSALAEDSNNIPNISVIQEPTFMKKAFSREKLRLMIMLAAGGLMAGLGLAFLIELLIDRTVKRPLELETRFQMPLLMSIPHVGSNGHNQLVSPWDSEHFIRPFSNAIRDRLCFEFHNLAHKPKMVAVTSSSSGAGSSTLAVSLATAFSETGDGKVLLVDTNVDRPEIHPFFEGKPICSLTEALQTGQDVDIRFKAADKYLFLAKAASRDNDSRQFVPKTLYDMMPQFKVSDFDYIIFDMPPY